MQKGSKNPEMKIAGFVYERQGMPGVLTGYNAKALTKMTNS
jgi:hypothetical protein